MPASYDESKGIYLDRAGKHFGSPILTQILKEPEKLKTLLAHSRNCLIDGQACYQEMFELKGRSLIEYLKVWRDMIESLYAGALDEVVPFEEARARLQKLSRSRPCRELFDILNSPDGKDVVWHNKHSLLLHLAFTFRHAPSAFFSSVYDAYDRRWLELNSTPLSRSEAYDCSGELLTQEIYRELKISGIDRQLYKNPDTCTDLPLEALEEAFLKVREELRDLAALRYNRVTERNRSVKSILKSTPLENRRCVKSLIDLLGQAIQINEDIHQRICYGANMLRITAQEMKLPFVPVDLAWQ